jgi:molybdenum cofactor cytidylyltransferase
MIAAVILAAGSGRRMGGPKALLRLKRETLLHRTARVALEAGCHPVLAIVGDWDPGLDDLLVQTLVNVGASEGMASSIRLGITTLPQESQAVLILAVDQPSVDGFMLQRLLALAAMDAARPAACGYGDTLGVPAVFPRRYFAELSALTGDRGAKSILQREAAAVMPFPEGEADLDTPEDLEALRR